MPKIIIVKFTIPDKVWNQLKQAFLTNNLVRIRQYSASARLDFTSLVLELKKDCAA